jgi:hypothetical protein
MKDVIAPTSETLDIRPWVDEVVDRIGFDPRSPYVERFWLGILGPSTTWLLRRIAAAFDSAPDGFAMPLVETARSIGLGDHCGRQSAFLRTLNRMVQFDAARPIGPAGLAVRRRLPPWVGANCSGSRLHCKLRTIDGWQSTVLTVKAARCLGRVKASPTRGEPSC